MLMSGCEGVKALKKSLSNYSVTIGLECGSTLSKIAMLFLACHVVTETSSTT